MNNSDYIHLAKRTEGDYAGAIERLSKEKAARILHAIIGLSTESGELLDQMKKHIYYGKDIDYINLKEEAGDVFWYLAILADALQIDFSQIMATNIAKLSKRYGEKFAKDKALLRDLNAERTVLEQYEYEENISLNERLQQG